MRRKRNLIPMPHIKPILQLIFSGMNRFGRLGLEPIEPKTSNSKKILQKIHFCHPSTDPFSLQSDPCLGAGNRSQSLAGRHDQIRHAHAW